MAVLNMDACMHAHKLHTLTVLLLLLLWWIAMCARWGGFAYHMRGDPTEW
jgi:hypothetical protein